MKKCMAQKKFKIKIAELDITLLVSTILFLGLFLGEWLTLWLKGTFIGKRKTITNDISMAVPSTNYQLTGLIWQCMIWQVYTWKEKTYTST